METENKNEKHHIAILLAYHKILDLTPREEVVQYIQAELKCQRKNAERIYELALDKVRDDEMLFDFASDDDGLIRKILYSSFIRTKQRAIAKRDVHSEVQTLKLIKDLLLPKEIANIDTKPDPEIERKKQERLEVLLSKYTTGELAETE